MKKKKKKSVKKIKRPKRITSRSYYIRACKLWKEIAYLRDGRECQVQKLWPRINLYHTKRYQVDHVITRRDSKYFFDPNNSLVVCSTCNRMKHLHQRGVGYAIDSITIDRIGLKVFDKMMAGHQAGGPNKGWKTVEYLKTIVEKLEHEYERLKGLPQPESRDSEDH